MNLFNGKTEERDLRGFCKIMIILRVICVGAVLSVVIFLTGAGFDIHDVLPIAGLLIVLFPLSAVWWLIYKSGYGLEKLVYSQLIADVAVVSGIVYFTGGVHSHLTFLYLISILLAGILLYLRGALVAATLSTVLFAVVSLMKEAHFERMIGATSNERAIVYLLFNVVLQAGFFYLIAVMSGYISGRVKVFGARLKTTTSQLEKARLDTRQIIESMSSGLITVDSRGVITEFNKSASRILRIDPAHVKGEDVNTVLGAICPDLCGGLIRALERGQLEERGEIYAETVDGPIPLGVSISLMRGRAGNTTGAVSVFQDLTEVKSLARRIRLADRLAALGELSAAIAHEIRTPLASICGSVEMLRESLKPSADEGKLMELVVKESERLRKIIDHFLEFAKARPSDFALVSLNSILAEVVCLVKNRQDLDKQVRIEFLPDAEIEACVDEETIKQVFYNLALNSLEAIDTSGELKISLNRIEHDQSGQAARVVFRDNGSGIAPADLGRVFEPFFTSKKSGTGLGLAIVSKIIEEHGGEVHIESKKGEGTEVTVSLPINGLDHERSQFGTGSRRELLETATT
jgi:two-component system sensor histidine kinase PilS (NtrC family)